MVLLCSHLSLLLCRTEGNRDGLVRSRGVLRPAGSYTEILADGWFVTRGLNLSFRFESACTRTYPTSNLAESKIHLQRVSSYCTHGGCIHAINRKRPVSVQPVGLVCHQRIGQPDRRLELMIAYKSGGVRYVYICAMSTIWLTDSLSLALS